MQVLEASRKFTAKTLQAPEVINQFFLSFFEIRNSSLPSAG